MDTNFITELVDSLRNITFSIPPEVFSGLSYLTRFVGYFFPLKLYLPIITLVLGMIFIQCSIKIITYLVDMGLELASFFAKKGK